MLQILMLMLWKAPAAGEAFCPGVNIKKRVPVFWDNTQGFWVWSLLVPAVDALCVGVPPCICRCLWVIQCVVVCDTNTAVPAPQETPGTGTLD